METHEQNRLISLGQKLRKARVSIGISQSQLAFEANLTREFINKLENGKLNVSLLNLDKICSVLGVEISKIV